MGIIIGVKFEEDEGTRIAEWTGPYGEKVVLGMKAGTSMETFETVVSHYLHGVSEAAEKMLEKSAK